MAGCYREAEKSSSSEKSRAKKQQRERGYFLIEKNFIGLEVTQFGAEENAHLVNYPVLRHKA